MNHYQQLKEVLNHIFELNKADLDFGIYRIMNQKRKQVSEFVEKQLPKDIKMALSETQSSDKTELEKDLKSLHKTLTDAGILPETSPKYNSLQERLQGIQNTDVIEQEVFSHLANFFRRYYKDGDFISMRRYKKDVYAIPYEGEEVKLHWANHDQYYIKSSENFKNYSFKITDNQKVTFQLKEVSTEQNNNKTQGDAERRFAIYKELPVEEKAGELLLNFIYEPFPKATKQETLLQEAVAILSQHIPANYTKVFTLSPTEKNNKRTVLEKHLNDYVAKNSFDYFIHKDLGGFLSRELDFYIKNEVLYLDDINTQQTEFFVAQLSKIKAIKNVAQKIITFLAQIENFQKKLWLKKKFVLRSDYCITLDKIDSKYYPEICQNQKQLTAWKKLFDINIQHPSELEFEPFLVVDTQFFDETFKDRLLAEFENLDAETDGLLINSENFQALNLMQEKYQEKIDVTYIDPPYNTDASPIMYKNSYRNSSWMSLMNDRLSVSIKLMSDAGILCVTIDDFQTNELVILMNDVFKKDNYLGTVVIRNNPSGRPTQSGLAISHEYGHFYSKSESSKLMKMSRSEEHSKRYKESDSKGKFMWE
ncbi:MAG: DNA methyltransferase, partial [Bacteroidia bacterium]